MSSNLESLALSLNTVLIKVNQLEVEMKEIKELLAKKATKAKATTEGAAPKESKTKSDFATNSLNWFKQRFGSATKDEVISITNITAEKYDEIYKEVSGKTPKEDERGAKIAAAVYGALTADGKAEIKKKWEAARELHKAENKLKNSESLSSTATSSTATSVASPPDSLLPTGFPLPANGGK